ncbi:MAG: hypothetical protein RL662_839 [Bacteroidota bacterium]|jgi:hypothetical protein
MFLYSYEDNPLTEKSNQKIIFFDGKMLFTHESFLICLTESSQDGLQHMF